MSGDSTSRLEEYKLVADNMASRSELLLAADVDHTLLASHESLGGELLALICRLLEIGQVRLAIITGNDYEKSQRWRVVEPIQEALRKNLIVYCDGYTRKLTFTDTGKEVESQDYHRQIAFEPGDKEIIKDLAPQLKEWAGSYPDLHTPDMEIQLSNGTIQLAIGPLNVNQPELEAQRDKFQERVIQELKQKCAEVQLGPSDKLWLRVHCKVREGDSPIRLKRVIEKGIRKLLSTDFPDLSRPTIIDRGEQLALKPVRADLRETLIGAIKDKVCGEKRLTKGQYGVLPGGRTTIDIQKYGVDKAFAMRDLQGSLDYQGEVLYFGDSFEEQGNDRPVAYVEGVQCISVRGGENLPSGVIAVDGGPAATKACLRSILWTLTGYPR